MFSPAHLSFPTFIERFRSAQNEAIDYTITSDKRFVALGLPTGSGKSGVAWALAQLIGNGSTRILTPTLGLQEQYKSTFEDVGLSDMRGRSNYACWEGGNCEDGLRLRCKDKEGCPYLCDFKAWQASDTGSTSYAWWLAANSKGQGMATPELLIADECHEAPDWLSRSLDFVIGEKQARIHGYPLPASPLGEDVAEWSAHAGAMQAAAQTALTRARAGARTSKTAQDIKHAERFLDVASSLSMIGEDNWVVTREDGTDYGRQWRFECVWPGQHRERLFRGAQRVVLMSGTNRPKLWGLLGIKASEVDFKEWGRQFPRKNGPVVWIPTVRVTHKMSGEDRQRWLARIAEICVARGDRKGLIHTVSYVRAKEVAEYLRGQGIRNVILNGAADLVDSQSARQAFEQHRRGAVDSKIVSPSFGTGWDFKRKLAEYQIIAKIPLPDTRSKIMQARIARDPTYPDYIAAQNLQQSVGRIIRDEDDRGETLIIDDSWSWFKTRAAGHFCKAFEARREEEVPRPTEVLAA